MEVFELLVVAPSEKQRQEWVDVIGHVLSQLVGGFSVYEGHGGWKGDGIAEVLYEPHTRIQAYCQDMSASEVLASISYTLGQYKDNCQQEVVLVVLNGEPLFLKEIPQVA
ncbi:MAG: hypothetical protein ACXABY_02490 [Candidatus Thorarchaeota archaeon]|jgi:hypothetical protein